MIYNVTKSTITANSTDISFTSPELESYLET